MMWSLTAASAARVELGGAAGKRHLLSGCEPLPRLRLRRLPCENRTRFRKRDRRPRLCASRLQRPLVRATDTRCFHAPGSLGDAWCGPRAPDIVAAPVGVIAPPSVALQTRHADIVP